MGMIANVGICLAVIILYISSIYGIPENEQVFWQAMYWFVGIGLAVILVVVVIMFLVAAYSTGDVKWRVDL